MTKHFATPVMALALAVQLVPVPARADSAMEYRLRTAELAVRLRPAAC